MEKELEHFDISEFADAVPREHFTDEYENNNYEPAGPKTALVAIIGRPSSGKSTFLNTASGEPVSIVSPIPQTTRNAIKGIVNTSFGQLVFVDTPGYHISEKKLNLKLQQVARDQLEAGECVLYVIDATRDIGEEEQMTAELIKPYASKTVVAINKIDIAGTKPEHVRKFIRAVLPEIPEDRISKVFTTWHQKLLIFIQRNIILTRKLGLESLRSFAVRQSTALLMKFLMPFMSIFLTWNLKKVERNFGFGPFYVSNGILRKVL